MGVPHDSKPWMKQSDVDKILNSYVVTRGATILSVKGKI